MTPAPALAQVEEERPFGELERYWNDPAYVAEIASQKAAHHRRTNAMFDAAIRPDLIRLGYVDAFVMYRML